MRVSPRLLANQASVRTNANVEVLSAPPLIPHPMQATAPHSNVLESKPLNLPQELARPNRWKDPSYLPNRSDIDQAARVYSEGNRPKEDDMREALCAFYL